MRYLLGFFVILSFLGVSNASDFDKRRTSFKPTNHHQVPLITPQSRAAGEDMASAVVISSLPFSISGNTSDNTNEYDAACPFNSSSAPEVCLLFVPTTDMTVSVNLIGSTYDTKTYIMLAGPS